MTPGPIETCFRKCVDRLQEEPRSWIKRTYACRDVFFDGKPVDCRCAMALIDLYTDHPRNIGAVSDLFREVLDIPSHMSIAQWNDADERTYAEVLSAFIEAAALARARGL